MTPEEIGADLARRREIYARQATEHMDAATILIREADALLHIYRAKLQAEPATIDDADTLRTVRGLITQAVERVDRASMPVVCCVCNAVRAGGEWVHQGYSGDTSRASHGYCPDCKRSAMEDDN